MLTQRCWEWKLERDLGENGWQFLVKLNPQLLNGLAAQPLGIWLLKRSEAMPTVPHLAKGAKVADGTEVVHQLPFK